RLSAEMVIIVEHYDQLLLDMLENLIQQHIGCAFRLLRKLIRLQVCENRFAEIRHALLDALREITKKHGRVTGGMVELRPNVGPALLSQDIGNQSWLARTGIGGDQRHR